MGAGLIALALAGCAPAMAPAAIPITQAPLHLCSAAPAPAPKNLASNPNYLEFSVDVVDTNGASVNLAQSDFVATENGQPISIAFFRADHGQPPASIGILVDKSGSMVTKLPVVDSTVAALMPKIGACDEVYIYAFGIDPILVSDFTTDHAAAGQRLKLVGAWGQTPFFDGVQRGVAHMDAGHYPDRVIIIFTDDAQSLDNASKNSSRDDLMNSARNTQTRFIVVGVGKPNSSKLPAIAFGPWTLGTSASDMDVTDLKKIAESLGGEFYPIIAEPDENAPKVALQPRDAAPLFKINYTPLAADPNQIQQIATSIASQIDNHYTIGVISAGPPASTANRITIGLANRPSARAIVNQVSPAAKTP